MTREILYGRQPVLEALRAGRRQLNCLLIAGTARSSPDMGRLLADAKRAGVPVRQVDRGRLDALSERGNHQGVVAEAAPYPYVEFDAFRGDSSSKPARVPLVLFLDHLQDPQNLGSILRTADAAGATGVVLPADRAAHVTPATVRASAGAAEHVRVAIVTNLVRAMQEVKDDGLWLAGLDSGPGASLLSEARLDGPLGLVVGSEGVGLSRLVRESCDFLVRLPMYGSVNSLNVGVATAIALYEVLRRRQTGTVAAT
jgi:23S rRNA (guanosine2251-2'-O)-methyltransferase